MSFRFLSLITFTLIASHAFAVDGVYMGNGLQGSFITSGDVEQNGVNGAAKYTTGVGFSAALGYGLPGRNIRVEGELSYRRNNVNLSNITADNSGDAQNVAAMLNAYYDIDTGFYGLKPYVGLGLGYGHVTISDAGFAEGHLAYQAMTGVTYAFPGGQEIYGGYRYHGMADPSNSTTKLEYRGHIIELGYRLPLMPAGTRQISSAPSQSLGDTLSGLNPFSSNKPPAVMDNQQRALYDNTANQAAAANYPVQHGYGSSYSGRNNPGDALAAYQAESSPYAMPPQQGMGGNPYATPAMPNGAGFTAQPPQPAMQQGGHPLATPYGIPPTTPAPAAIGGQYPTGGMVRYY